MLKIINDADLTSLNTFGVKAKAKKLIFIEQPHHLEEAFDKGFFSRSSKLILGGGSNVLFTKDFEGIVIKIDLKGKHIEETNHKEALGVGLAGENWHDFVLFTLESHWSGLENLSLIPGSLGAAPVQNIGAYGVELEDIFEYTDAFHLETGKIKRFYKEDCKFGYRMSVFKGIEKGKYLIVRVALRVNRNDVVVTSYGTINQWLKDHHINHPTSADVSNAVIAIRQSKLPDPEEIGNAGSYFKNPIVSKSIFEQLISQHPEMPHYPNEEGVKVPAGWLIDRCGWKGFRKGDVGVHKNQALVLVNYGGGTGEELFQLSKDIQESVYAEFGIQLEPEVNIL